MIYAGLPNLQSAVMAWAQITNVYVVCKRQQDFKTVESYILRSVRMVRIPTNQPLDMKREGQRRWNDEKIYSEISLDLKVDDIIAFGCEGCERFRVMEKIDYSQYGYFEYSIRSDYK